MEATMKTRIQKWGNSLTVRIPKTFADETGLTTDSAVEITLTEVQIIITPLTQPTLEDLLAQITDDNIHTETDTGDPIGNEVG
jgi:antitoxin MazE